MDRYDAPGPSRLGYQNESSTIYPVESPFDEMTVSEVYGASASSVAEASQSEKEDYFVGVKAGETEVEEKRSRRRSEETERKAYV